MIRCAVDGDLAALRRIWDACFPGDAEFADFFFTELYKPEQALVFENTDKSSALHMLPFMRNDGAKVTYIYGVGTLPEHRRKGQSAALIKEALALNDICFLIPQEPWLFGFYEQFGFETVFYKRKFTVEGLETARRALSSDILSLDSIYKNSVDIRVERTVRHWEHILANNVLIWDGGYAILDGGTVLEAFGTKTTCEMTDIPFGMANKWNDNNAYLEFMYN